MSNERSSQTMIKHNNTHVKELHSAEVFTFKNKKTEGVCIPLGGNIRLRGNSVSILLISSERVGIF